MVYNFGIYDGPRGEARNNPLYGFWSRMIERCYSMKSLSRNDTYENTIVCEEWKYFSVFETWAKKQVIVDNYVLDKDLIGGSSNVYSPETCTFIPQELNKCILDRRSNTVLPIGVWYKNKSSRMINERTKPYVAEIVKYGSGVKLGHYSTPEEAHRSWQIAKIKYFLELIEKYKCSVTLGVIEGLERRIQLIENDISNNVITITVNKV